MEERGASKQSIPLAANTPGVTIYYVHPGGSVPLHCLLTKNILLILASSCWETFLIIFSRRGSPVRTALFTSSFSPGPRTICCALRGWQARLIPNATTSGSTSSSGWSKIIFISCKGGEGERWKERKEKIGNMVLTIVLPHHLSSNKRIKVLPLHYIMPWDKLFALLKALHPSLPSLPLSLTLLLSPPLTHVL